MPKEPPVADNVDEDPEHIDVGNADAKLADVDSVFIVTVVFTQVVLLQSPTAAT